MNTLATRLSPVVSPAPTSGRWIGIVFVALIHALVLWLLFEHRLIVAPATATTLFVNFISPPVPAPRAAPRPVPTPPKPVVPPRPQPLAAITPAVVAAPDVVPLPAPDVTLETPAPPRPSSPPTPIEHVPPSQAAPTPLLQGPVTLENELAVSCPERIAPTYPPRSRRNGEEGTVVLEVDLNENGAVGRAHVRHSSGFPRLDEAALAAVRAWRCQPAVRNGQFVRATALQPFNFVLQGS